MNNSEPRSHRPGSIRAAGLVGMACLLAGCQSYQAAPLDLDRHRAVVQTRLADTESLKAFVDRLASGGWTVPARFTLDDGLNAAEGEILALFYNPDLRLARMEAGIALATRETAGLWEDPEFGFDGAELLSPSGPFEYGLTLSLTIPISGRLGVEKARANAAYEVELRRIVDAEWGVRARVRTAWGAWSAASERVGLLREVVGRVERIATVIDRLESKGELTRVEARLVRAELVTSRGQLLAAERDATQARLKLLGLMGLLPDATILLHPELAREETHADAEDTEAIIRRNTELAVRRAEYQVAEESLRLEIRKQYPDITIGAGYGDEEGDRLLLGVSMPIPILNANRAGIAEARARREVSRVAAETSFERLLHRLASARADLSAAEAQRAAFESELVPMLDQQISEIERLAGLGQVDTLLLLETVTRRYEAKSTLLDLRQRELQAAIEIRRLLGPREDALPTPPITINAPSSPNSTTLPSGDIHAQEASR